MPVYYDEITGQIEADIKSVIGDGAQVVFGNPRRPMTSLPCAVVVLTDETRDPIVRAREESYEFTIELRLPLPDPYPERGHEPYLMSVARDLILVMTPYTKTGVPTYGGPYGGIGYGQKITSVKPVFGDQTDAYIAVDLVFQVATKISQ